VTGAGWAAAGGVLLWGILTGAPRTRPAIPMAVTIWLIEYWVERSFFESPQVNLPFAAAVSLLVLSLTLIITWHKGTKEFFSRSEEYEQQNQNPGSQ
jgi:K+ transporter